MSSSLGNHNVITPGQAVVFTMAKRSRGGLIDNVIEMDKFLSTFRLTNSSLMLQ